MKTALCLSGQPRFYRECFPKIKANIIDQLEDVDIFIATTTPDDKPVRFVSDTVEVGWRDYRIPENAIGDLLELYKPKAIQASEPVPYIPNGISFASLKEACSHYFSEINHAGFLEHLVYRSYNMWKQMYEAYTLSAPYGVYDCYIRCRLDLIPHIPIDFNVDLNYLYYEEMGQPDGMISDWFNFGSFNIMSEYFKIGRVYLKYLYDCLMEDNRWCNELMIKKMAQKHHLPVKGMQWGLSLPRL